MSAGTIGGPTIVRLRTPAGAPAGFASVELLDVQDAAVGDADQTVPTPEEPSDLEGDSCGRWESRGFANIRDVVTAAGLRADQAWLDAVTGEVLVSTRGVDGSERLSLIAPADAPGDFDHDGVASAADIGAFVGSYSRAESDADWNGDGRVDAADLVRFLGEWSVGAGG